MQAIKAPDISNSPVHEKMRTLKGNKSFSIGRIIGHRQVEKQVQHQYISSFIRCDRWEAKGGKRRALFDKSRDTRWIIKEINQPYLKSGTATLVMSCRLYGPSIFDFPILPANAVLNFPVEVVKESLWNMEDVNLNDGESPVIALKRKHSMRN
ncbi:hypothetical protein YC2023_056761 [Brassica napus]